MDRSVEKTGGALNNTFRGFTLVELLIVVAIVGIITSIGYPAYQEFLMKGRRSDAKIALTQGAALQEKDFYEHGAYESNANLLWPPNGKSAQGYYTMSISLSGGGGSTPHFTLTATATGTQIKDSSCQSFSLDDLGNKTSSPGSDCW